MHKMTQIHYAREAFISDLHELLVYNCGINEKFIQLSSTNMASTLVLIYVQRASKYVLTIKVHMGAEASDHGKATFEMLSDHPTIMTEISQLQSVKDMQRYISEARDDAHQEAMIDTLKYPNL